MQARMRRGVAVAGLCLLSAACSLDSPASAPTQGAAGVSRATPSGPARSGAAESGAAESGAATSESGASAGSSTEPGQRSFTLVATGDMLLHEPLWTQARKDAARSGNKPMDFGPMLSAIKPHVAGADLALCHLETPLAPRRGPYRAYPSFAGPPQIVPAMKATGYDACTTGSNHTFDQGADGVNRTLDALDDAGMAHSGSARNRAESTKTTIVEAGGVKVALLSFTYGFNGVPYPGGDRWRANLIDADRIADAAKTARTRGAEVVVLAMHWGTEYQHTPSAQQLRLAPRLARSPDIDVVIGHHAHVVQPIEKIGRTWVVYGLGNLVAWHSTPGRANAEGLLVRFTFTEESRRRFAVTKAEYQPLLVAKDPPVRVLDVPTALAERAYGSSSRSRLQEALRRTTRVVTSRGAVDDGLTPLADPAG